MNETQITVASSNGKVFLHISNSGKIMGMRVDSVARLSKTMARQLAEQLTWHADNTQRKAKARHARK